MSWTFALLVALVICVLLCFIHRTVKYFAWVGYALLLRAFIDSAAFFRFFGGWSPALYVPAMTAGLGLLFIAVAKFFPKRQG